MTQRRTFTALLGAGLVLASSRANAAPGDATRLEYARDSGARNCPDRAALREAVAKRIGYDPFFPTARQAVVVEITSVADGLHAELRLLDENGIIRGSRDLHERAQHCDELVASLALAISIALDPAAALDTPPAEPEPNPNTEAAAEPASSPADIPTPTRDALPEPARTTQPRTRPAVPSKNAGPFSIRAVAFRVEGFAAFGTTPAMAGGFRLAAGLRSDWWSLSAEFADQLPVSKPFDGGGRARASQVNAALAPCLARRWANVCGLASVGSLTTEGEQVPAPFRQSTAQVYVGARIAFTPELTRRLRLVADVDVLKPLMPVTLRLREQDVWRTPTLTGALGLGLEVQFP